MTELSPDVSAWETKIATWLKATGRTETWFREVATDCLGLREGERTASAQQQVAKALKSLGWVKDKQQSYRGQHRVVVWRAPK